MAATHPVRSVSFVARPSRPPPRLTTPSQRTDRAGGPGALAVPLPRGVTHEVLSRDSRHTIMI